MQKKVFIGCGAGFSGDRFDASIRIVKEFRNMIIRKVRQADKFSDHRVKRRNDVRKMGTGDRRIR